MPGTREVKRRIKSISSTKKITKAMQMVSAVKMRKAQSAALASRAYSDMAWQIATNLSHKIDAKHSRFLKQNKASRKIGIILVTSNKGLVGSFNSNLVSAVHSYIANSKAEAEVLVEIITVGKKGRDAMLRVGQTIIAEFNKLDKLARMGEILPISRLIIDEFLQGNYGKICIAYNHFISTISQKPVIHEILPLGKSKGKFLDIDNARQEKNLPEHYGKYNFEYLFEPNPNKVLDYLLPRILESQIYQAILESDASENSARMVMMKNATEAASDLIDDLTLAYNQIRQANITKELAEIVAGMDAV